jgi:class 3 adenylate cyclase
VRELSYDWTWVLPASAEDLWPLASDTNRFNRDAGLPPVEDLRTPDERLANARRRLRLRVKGVTLEWEELPFEWLRPFSFGVVRRYSRGPLVEMRVHATLEPLGERSTRLRYRVSAHPRGLFGLLTTPVQIGVISRIGFGRTFRRYAETVGREPEPKRPPPWDLRSHRRLYRVRRALVDQGVEAAAADRLIAHVLATDDLSLARVRPYQLASAWGLARRDALTLCLCATRAGLLDLSWDVVCPRCLGAKERATTLRELRAGMVHCDTCLVDFTTDFAQSVEISFTPTPSIREVLAPPFCVAGPQISPHVEVQQLLGPGEARAVQGIMEEGRHRVRAWGTGGGPSFLVARGGAGEAELRLTEEGWCGHVPELAPEARLRLVNDTGTERLFDVERMAWADDAATAADVTATHRFRDLFSEEVLAAGEFMGVGNLAVVFTDLRASTRLYRRIGDAPAFGRVMQHFEVLERAVLEHDGAIVKTIGDAVMAVFSHPDEALEAVRDAQLALREADEPLVLKAGVHFGSCIAVTLNERLDYFGSTVNIAARLGSISGGDDIAISDEVHEDDAVRRTLGGWGSTVSSFTTDVRGLERPLRVWRVAEHLHGEGGAA